MFGVYIHVPYCIQRCSYCDFATYEQSQILPPEKYVEVVQSEMEQRVPHFAGRSVDTIYFGGGTPSLIPPHLIVSLIEGLARHGLKIRPEVEITIEINPATINPQKMETYLKGGVNRFSVGAQTFDEALLKKVKREHSAQQTRETLNLLKSYGVNYSLDLLFALPGQDMAILDRDLDEILSFHPPHVSPYCLTIPENHILNPGRPDDDQQIAMFAQIRTALEKAGLYRYEISNFAKPGFESRHNGLYWDDSDYLGLGLSAHSYLAQSPGPWGMRFWNAKTIDGYAEQIRSASPNLQEAFQNQIPTAQLELLNADQSLSDFCHTHLRTSQGLDRMKMQTKFGPDMTRQAEEILIRLRDRNKWVEAKNEGVWTLTEDGILLSNQVFAALTFS